MWWGLPFSWRFWEKAFSTRPFQAYVSNRVSFRRRGFVIGIMETAWAGSTLLTIPLLGLLMDHSGWRTAFGALAAGAALSMVLLFKAAPPLSKRTKGRFGSLSGLLVSVKQMFKSPATGSVSGFYVFGERRQ